MSDNDNNYDDFYEINSSLKLNATQLTREYKKLKHIMESCDKLSVNLMNNLNPLESKFRSLSATFNSFMQQNLKSFSSSFLNGVLGNQGSGGYGSIGQSLGKYMAGMFGGARASGGNVAAGMPYIVGEKGAEMFVPNQSGYIVPNNQMGGNARPINIVMNISTPDADSFQRSQSQILARAARAMQGAGREL